MGVEWLSVDSVYAIVHTVVVEQISLPRARDAFILRVRMRGPWLIDVRDRTPLSLICPLRGSCVIRRGGEVVHLAAFEAALVSGTQSYHVTADPEPRAPARYMVLPGQECVGPDGAPVDQQLRQGIRTWGNDLNGPDEILVGTYTSLSSVTDLLLGRRMLKVPGETTLSWVELLAAEAERSSPVQAGVLDRLLDILTLRALAAIQVAPGGVGRTGAAVNALWEDPARSWTVAQLAERSRMSRSAFAKAFRRDMGDTPASYLTTLRLAIAADALRDSGESGDTLDQIARRVGYSTGFALSEAFRREWGIRPSLIRSGS